MAVLVEVDETEFRVTHNDPGVPYPHDRIEKEDPLFVEKFLTPEGQKQFQEEAAKMVCF